jgi:hypothetical protein
VFLTPLCPHLPIKNEKSLSTLHKLECEICLEDINKYYDLSAEIVDVNQQLLELASVHVQGSRSLSAGRVVVLRDGVRYPLFFWSVSFPQVKVM